MQANAFIKLGFGAVALLVIASLTSCNRAGGDFPGREFVPDMAHSTAYEANVYWDYSLNTWDEESVIKRRVLSMPRLPVKGSIARGYAGGATDDMSMFDGSMHRNASYTPPSGAVPYYYQDTEEDREAASAAITRNPYAITANGLERGKLLYNTFCGICHGEKGDGNGYLVREDGGVYPAQPISLISEELINSTEGRFYHSIMYGKNVMGAYKDKLSYEERWQVIHHIRALQAKEAKLEYNENENTLNASATPKAKLAQQAEMQ
jgi:mono/diheme cytochrome c family protein